ncbi:DUF924 family protein [Lysobacter silvisoli]|uniref:DUF924 domain-containing protein n=1 Tax=Lysobacter silvisoli TaxID=2293254 RepID=A0A371JWI8_9GAMM|nr:DUF924 family protein [Lysobacter silvisoli]RDZ26000.1 DUF924 domain-containing protein [Lysobacter silvisoli]
MTLPTAREVVDFWRNAGYTQWFDGGPAFDSLCRERFLDAHLRAARRELDEWMAQGETGSLALLILLDQIPRNVFRGSGHAYATDPLARMYARQAVARGDDQRTEAALRSFYYLPFEHSEALEDQLRSVELHRTLPVSEAAPDPAQWAVHHQEIIERYGRFPHRNRALGRESTAEEQAYLDNGGFKG